MRINVDDQFPELAAHLSDVYRQLNGDLTPLMAGIGNVLENSTRQRFEDKKSPSGVTWEALAPSTLQTKNGRGSLMVDYGDLMRSITNHASAVSVAVGTDRPYGKYHQTGTKNSDGSERMPSRSFLGLSEQDKTDILALVNDFASGVING